MKKYLNKKVLRTAPNKVGEKGFMEYPIIIHKITDGHLYYHSEDGERALPRFDWDDGNWCLWEGGDEETAWKDSKIYMSTTDDDGNWFTVKDSCLYHSKDRREAAPCSCRYGREEGGDA